MVSHTMSGIKRMNKNLFTLVNWVKMMKVSKWFQKVIIVIKIIIWLVILKVTKD